MRLTDRAFVRRLLSWYADAARDLPWRRTADPYRIWVAEIMLQQTRVEAVVPYYERFLERYPNAAALAAAPEQELLQAWAGLGYYRRARLLQRTATKIAGEHDGQLPRDYDAIRALDGVGGYTAAAVASIAFDLPFAVLDGNVMRLLTRLANDRRDIAKGETKRALAGRAQELMDAAAPGERGAFNQALMELGATVCTPKSPQCGACPLARDCRGLAQGAADTLPYKSVRPRIRRVELAVAVVRRGGSLLMRQRPQDAAIMPGFWELPSTCGTGGHEAYFASLGVAVGKKIGEFKHSITDRRFRGSIYEAALHRGRPQGHCWISAERLSRLPVTTISRKALRQDMLAGPTQ